MDKTQQLMKQKKRRWALSAAVTVLLVLLVAVFAVKLAYKLPWRFDMTAQRIFTLSGQSTALLDGLDQEVRIAAVYPRGSEEMMVASLLEEYEKASDLITVEFIDAELEPAKLARYELDVAAIPNGTLIVKSGNGYRLIMNSTLFTTSDEGNLFNGEREITGAIRSVTSDDLSKVYFLQGHQEANPDEKMSVAVSALQTDAYEVERLSLAQTEGVPADADAVVIASPKEDITEEELEMLRAYQRTGGGILLLVDAVMNSNSIQLPNLNALCNGFGVDITNNYVVEEDANHYLSASQLYLIPDVGPHEITTPIAESRKMIILPIVRGLGAYDYDKTSVTVTPLLASSEKSWVRVDMTIDSAARTERDVSGPIALAYAATVSNVKWGNSAARAVVVGNGSFVYDGNIEAQANQDFFLNSLNWVVGSHESQFIPSKVINADRLVITGSSFVKLAVICVAVLPMIAFAGGLFVWFYRRNQ